MPRLVLFFLTASFPHEIMNSCGSSLCFSRRLLWFLISSLAYAGCFHRTEGVSRECQERGFSTVFSPEVFRRCRASIWRRTFWLYSPRLTTMLFCLPILTQKTNERYHVQGVNSSMSLEQEKPPNWRAGQENKSSSSRQSRGSGWITSTVIHETLNDKKEDLSTPLFLTVMAPWTAKSLIFS